MKKSLFIGLVAVLGLVGCSRNQEIDVPDANLSLFARTESPAESRTVVESGVHVYWEPGDEIAVFMGEKSAKFTTDITSASGTATFKGTFGNQGWPEELDLWAVYPYSEDAVFDGEKITTVIPSVQIAREESFAKGANVSIAHSTSSTIQFYNVCGGVRFTVEEEGISSVCFTSSNHEPIAGTISISLNEEGIPFIKDVIEGEDSILLKAPDGTTFIPGKFYFLTALPTHLSGGYSFTLIKNNQSASKVSKNTIQIKRSIFGTLDRIDMDLDFHDLMTEEDLSVMIASLSSIIGECINADDDNVNDLFHQHIEEVRCLPAVQDAFSNDNGAFVLLQNGTIIECPFHADSIFDKEDVASSPTNQIRKQTSARTKTKKGKASLKEAKVIVFNLFSNTESRSVQNQIVDSTVDVFISEYGEENVYYGSFEDFTSDNLSEAIVSENCEILFVYSLGSGARVGSGVIGDEFVDWLGLTEENAVAYGQKLAIGGVEIKDISELNFLFRNGIISGYDYILFDYSSKSMYRTIDLPTFFFLPEHYPLTDKIIYFGSCYTMSSGVFDRPEWGKNTHLLGWTGVNRLGQAYGLVMSDYLTQNNRSLEAFWNDFNDSDGKIVDPWCLEDLLNKLDKSELIQKGKRLSSNMGEDWQDGTETKLFHFVRPKNGACFHSSFIWPESCTVDVKVKYENINGLSLDLFSGISSNSYVQAEAFGFVFEDEHYITNTIRQSISYIGFNAKKLSFEHIKPGVLKLSASFGGSGINDVRYVFITTNMATNDAQFVDPDEVMLVPEAIDMGLPSNVKWASFNLGATSPEEYGAYFAWGETEPSKYKYGWDTYSWCDGSESSLTKYYSGDGKTSLDQADDAAYEHLGGEWRMPSESDWKELIANCNWSTTSSNGIAGVLATSKITGAKVFFPFSGKKDGTNMSNVGSIGYYWTSSINPFQSLACIGTTSPDTGYLERYCGLAIRPVFGEASTGNDYATPDAVDLGLSVKWASFNLGATRPEEYGDYFAWGETEPYYETGYAQSESPIWKAGKEAGYSPLSYKWCVDSSSDKITNLTKYCTDSSMGYNGFTDGKTVLEPEDDAAHVNLGGNWRMPTHAEWKELNDNCTWAMTTQNGVDGILVTASNGNSIFLPATASRLFAIYDTILYSSYWSSSLQTKFPDCARHVTIYSSSSDFWSSTYRCYGFPVRPVSE